MPTGKIKERKQRLIDKNNIMENKKRIPHIYKVNDLALVKNQKSTKYGQNAYNGPWTITEVRNNGTVTH